MGEDRDMLGRHIGRILEPLTSGEDLPGILNLLCQIVEDDLANKSVSATIIMPDRSNDYVKVVAGPSLTTDHSTAIEQLPPVPAGDIAAYPLRADYRELAERSGLVDCACYPIATHDGDVLGVLALHGTSPLKLSRKDDQNIEQVTLVAAIAIQRTESEREKEKYAAALAHDPRHNCPNRK
jgi:GAF domain-containing protein